MAAPPKGSKSQKRRSKPDFQAGIEPGVRTFTTWTPSLIKNAELSADGGNIRAAADLCDWVLADERVKGCLGTRMNALFGLEPSFEASGDGRRKNRAVKALEAGEDYWASYPAATLTLMHSWGIVLGLGPMQHDPKVLRDKGGNVQHGGRLLPCPEFWHPQHLRFDNRERAWKTRIESTIGGLTEVVLDPGDGQWILHQPFGTHRPQMLGLWRGLSRWVLLKYLAMGDWASASGRASVLAATHETQAAQKDELARSARQQRQELAQDIYQRGRDGVIVLPPGFKLGAINATANSETIYRSQIELANEAIAIALRGGNLTTNVKGGSLAATEAQERLGDQANLVWDGDAVSTTLHDQSLEYWALWNFGDSALAPWPVYPTKPKRDNKARAETVTAATDAAEGLLSLGLQVKQQAFIDEWELSTWVEPSAGDALLVKPAPNPDGPPPGPNEPEPAPAPQPTPET